MRHTVDGTGVVGVTHDVTTRKQIELRLEAMANVDGLMASPIGALSTAPLRSRSGARAASVNPCPC